LISEYEKIVTKNTYMILEQDGLATANVLLEKLFNKNSVADVPNIVYFGNGKIHYTDKKNIEPDINAAYPQWSNLANLTENVAFVRTSKGCAYNCKFCTFPGAVAGFEQRSLESIREELRQIHKIGIRYLAFTDDHFAISQKRVKEICNMMLEERFNFIWFAGIRASSITEENAELLSKAGCRILCVGLESGDDRILRLMNKRTTTSGNMRCLELLERHGIVAYGSFIIGFPGETEESFETTIQWINSSPLKLYKVFMFYLFPGSAIYAEQDAHSITFFGGEYDFSLWKTPTMDALRSSEMIKEFILRVEKAALIYSYSPMYAFFPFLLKGYSIDESLKFLLLHTDLVKNELSQTPYLLKIRSRSAKLREIQTLLKHN
jgi:p-methyltransferase